VFTFIIAYKNSSDLRFRNLVFLLKNLKKINADIIISEQKEPDSTNKEGSAFIKKGALFTRIMYYSNSPFHKSRLYNIAGENSKTKYLWFIDADVILDFESVIQQVDDQDLISPFSEVYRINEEESNLFIKKSSATNLHKGNPDTYVSKYSILVKKEKFDSSNGFDNNIVGWGWEDLDFVHNKLKEITPFVVKNATGYHLYHEESCRNFERKNFYIYKENFSSVKKISFCISIKNRKSQIKKTLLKNLEDNIMFQDHCEFVVTDFGSQDSVFEWLISSFPEHIKSGYLKLFKIFDFPYWHASIAKNTTHYLSEGKILVNLDCDNFVGKNGALYLYNIFFKNSNINMCHQWCRKEWFSGNYGRISMRREVFEKSGGYDESFYGMGYQDTDLINRVNALYPDSTLLLDNSKYNKSIKNDKNLSIKNLTNLEKEKGFFYINSENEKKSKSNLANFKLVANNGVFGIRHDIMYYDIDKKTYHPICS